MLGEIAVLIDTLEISKVDIVIGVKIDVFQYAGQKFRKTEWIRYTKRDLN